MISPTQAGHVHDTLLMDIHIAGCRDRKREESEGIVMSCGAFGPNTDAVVTFLMTNSYDDE